MKEWKDIARFEGKFQISSEGRVKSLNYHRSGKEKLLKLRKDKGGYLYVGLYKEGKEELKRIHRLVAEAFIPNPEGKPCVNHKDECKTNNFVENLEWCDHKYNNNYGTHNERMIKTLINRKDLSKQVYQYTLEGELVKIWPSTMECDRNGFDYRKVAACCRGERKTHKGFRWSYVPL